MPRHFLTLSVLIVAQPLACAAIVGLETVSGDGGVSDAGPLRLDGPQRNDGTHGGSGSGASGSGSGLTSGSGSSSGTSSGAGSSSGSGTGSGPDSGTGSASGTGSGDGGCGANETRCGGSCVATHGSDNNNCGGCGLTCSDCQSGECVVVLTSSNQSYAFGIAVNSTDIYWLSNESLLTMSTDGGPISTITSASPPAAGGLNAIVATDTKVFWCNDTMPATPSLIGEVTLQGMVVGTVAGSQDIPYGVTTDGTNVYWVNYGTGNGFPGTVMRTTVSGGADTTLASGQNVGGTIAVANGNVYWVANGNVMTVPANGGSPVAFASGASLVAAAVDTVFWISSLGEVLSAPATAEPAVSPAILGHTTSMTAEPFGMTSFDGTNVYWVEYSSGNIMKASTGASASVTLATGQVDAWAVAADAHSVYWTVNDEQAQQARVVKVTPN